MSEVLNVETHCHNVFSNHKNYSSRVPFDCGVTIEEQLENAYHEKIDVMFITNHNTLDGYSQILEYKQNHAKYRNIRIYPAEEVTINNKGHVLAYGIEKEIRSGMTLEETLDEDRKNTRLNSKSPYDLVCRLLLEKKKSSHISSRPIAHGTSHPRSGYIRVSLSICVPSSWSRSGAFIFTT